MCQWELFKFLLKWSSGWLTLRIQSRIVKCCYFESSTSSSSALQLPPSSSVFVFFFSSPFGCPLREPLRRLHGMLFLSKFTCHQMYFYIQTFMTCLICFRRSVGRTATMRAETIFGSSHPENKRSSAALKSIHNERVFAFHVTRPSHNVWRFPLFQKDDGRMLCE